MGKKQSRETLFRDHRKNKVKRRVYLLPGIMCNEQLWSEIKPLLEMNYELIHLRIPLKSSLDEIVDYLYDSIKESKINLLGFSLGGYIAAYFACKYPQKMNRLFVMAATPCDLPKNEIIKRKKVLELNKRLGFKSLSRQKIITLLDEKNADNEYLIDLIAKMYEDLGEEEFTHQLQSTLRREDLFEQLLNLDISMTFLYSMNDALLNQPWLKKFERQSSAHIIKLKSASHMLPLEEPELVATQIKEFMR